MLDNGHDCVIACLRKGRNHIILSPIVEHLDLNPHKADGYFSATIRCIVYVDFTKVPSIGSS